MLNTAVSLGRAGIHVHFIGKSGNDHAAGLITRFLEENHVGTDFLERSCDEKTTVALAFLNPSSDAGYSFYKSGTPEMLNITFPEVTHRDIILFGSFYSLNPDIREKLVPFLRMARQNRAIILYDPNFRKPHLSELERVRPLILENISFSDLIRGSDEDFLNIFACRNAERAFAKISPEGNPALIYTRNRKNVSILTGKTQSAVRVPPIVPVSTIGAGDAFNAGVIFAMVTMGIEKEQVPGLPVSRWKEIIRVAIRFAGDVCKYMDNYISFEFADNLEK